MNKNPSYHVITLEVPVSEQDMAQGILYQNGCLGLEEENANGNNVKLRCYFDAQIPLSEFSPQVLSWLPKATITHATSIDLNAISAMIPTFEPVEILDGIFIIPPEDVPHTQTITSGQTLIIRPGMGFGTGRHETTQLVLKAMMKHGAHAKTLLDVGSGSGVLSIFGSLILHIPLVHAVEIDEHARVNAGENYILNNTSEIIQYSGIQEIEGRVYDLIVANIISSTLMYLKPKITRAMSQKSILILSGILETEKNEILEAFSEFKLVEINQQKEWLSFVFIPI
ncbi:MAG: hypothetical protein ACD_73C00718G0007 [uncultured bacterium]|nr:MAG: hypothetical protein ACD_73C00718G0007 [uncultured bacterium]